jgi:hypothetical protein
MIIISSYNVQGKTCDKRQVILRNWLYWKRNFLCNVIVITVWVYNFYASTCFWPSLHNLSLDIIQSLLYFTIAQILLALGLLGSWNEFLPFSVLKCTPFHSSFLFFAYILVFYLFIVSTLNTLSRAICGQGCYYFFSFHINLLDSVPFLSFSLIFFYFLLFSALVYTVFL